MKNYRILMKTMKTSSMLYAFSICMLNFDKNNCVLKLLRKIDYEL